MITQIQSALQLKANYMTKDPQDLVNGIELFAQKELPALQSPAMVLLQHEDESIASLRPRQVSALKTYWSVQATGSHLKN